MVGAVERVRPKMMTVVAIMAGLLPILWSTGTGSEVMQRIAVPMIGGMVSSTLLTLIVIPPSTAWSRAMVVTRDPNCGCCRGWVTHMRKAGFPVEIVEVADVTPLKTRLGVPDSLMSCHTAEIGGYVVEGHVPAEAIKRLLIERPKVTGLAVAGMPVGSPGMQVPGQAPEDDVVIFSASRQHVFARYRGLQQI
jgi:hypothetical protein